MKTATLFMDNSAYPSRDTERGKRSTTQIVSTFGGDLSRDVNCGVGLGIGRVSAACLDVDGDVVGNGQRHRRVVLFTGEGSHQLTAQEIGQFHRYGLRPIIFVLNNSGYLIERLLCKDPDVAYNDVAPWNYAELPHALGCDDWFTAKVTTCAELDAAMAVAEKGDSAAYIEVITDADAAPLLPLKLHESINTLAPKCGQAAPRRNT
jgi:TPP-dependent 2-oxoacid decarboxylase